MRFAATSFENQTQNQSLSPLPLPSIWKQSLFLCFKMPKYTKYLVVLWEMSKKVEFEAKTILLENVSNFQGQKEKRKLFYQQHFLNGIQLLLSWRQLKLKNWNCKSGDWPTFVGHRKGPFDLCLHFGLPGLLCWHFLFPVFSSSGRKTTAFLGSSLGSFLLLRIQVMLYFQVTRALSLIYNSNRKGSCVTINKVSNVRPLFGLSRV